MIHSTKDHRDPQSPPSAFIAGIWHLPSVIWSPFSHWQLRVHPSISPSTGVSASESKFPPECGMPLASERRCDLRLASGDWALAIHWQFNLHPHFFSLFPFPFCQWSSGPVFRWSSVPVVQCPSVPVFVRFVWSSKQTSPESRDSWSLARLGLGEMDLHLRESDVKKVLVLGTSASAGASAGGCSPCWPGPFPAEA